MFSWVNFGIFKVVHGPGAPPGYPTAITDNSFLVRFANLWSNWVTTLLFDCLALLRYPQGQWSNWRKGRGHDAPLEALGGLPCRKQGPSFSKKTKAFLVTVSKFRVKQETDCDVIDGGAKREDHCSSQRFPAWIYHQQLCSKTFNQNYLLLKDKFATVHDNTTLQCMHDTVHIFSLS